MWSSTWSAVPPFAAAVEPVCSMGNAAAAGGGGGGGAWLRAPAAAPSGDTLLASERISITFSCLISTALVISSVGEAEDILRFVFFFFFSFFFFPPSPSPPFLSLCKVHSSSCSQPALADQVSSRPRNNH